MINLQQNNLFCLICGDKASGYHYGALSCNSCNTFIVRTVVNRKTYQCRQNGVCEVDRFNRGQCQYCRFEKCKKMGMRIKDVLRKKSPAKNKSFVGVHQQNGTKRERNLKSQESVASVVGMPPGVNLVPYAFALQQSYFNLLTFNTKSENPPISDPHIPSLQLDNLLGSNIFPPFPFSFPTGQSLHGQFWPHTDGIKRVNDCVAPIPSIAQAPFNIILLLNTMLPSSVEPTVHTVAQYNSPEINELCKTLPKEDGMHQLIEQSKMVNQNALSFAVLVGDKNIHEIEKWLNSDSNFAELTLDDRTKLLNFNWATVHLMDFTYAMVHDHLQEAYTTANGDTVCTDHIALMGCIDQIPVWKEVIAKLAGDFNRNNYAALRVLALFDLSVVNNDLVIAKQLHVMSHWKKDENVTGLFVILNDIRKIARACIKFIRAQSKTSPDSLANFTLDNSMLISMTQDSVMSFLDAEP